MNNSLKDFPLQPGNLVKTNRTLFVSGRPPNVRDYIIQSGEFCIFLEAKTNSQHKSYYSVPHGELIIISLLYNECIASIPLFKYNLDALSVIK